jgi:hypothetical protein
MLNGLGGLRPSPLLAAMALGTAPLLAGSPVAQPVGASSSGVHEGTRGDDTLTGSGGDDVIIGKAGDDRLRGLGGNDTLVGGAGRDRLTGGSGHDTLVPGPVATASWAVVATTRSTLGTGHVRRPAADLAGTRW